MNCKLLAFPSSSFLFPKTRRNMNDIKLLIYITDDSDVCFKNVQNVASDLRNRFANAITIDFEIFNAKHPNKKYVCEHVSPKEIACCYDKIFFVHDYKRRLELPIAVSQTDCERISTSIPRFLNPQYEAVKFNKSRLNANVFFVYDSKKRGVWQLISGLLPAPNEIIGEIAPLGDVCRSNDLFVKKIDTKIQKPLFELRIIQREDE